MLLVNALNDIGAIILLAVIYVAALAPALAYPAGLPTAMIAVLGYILLVILRQEERGLPVALLFLMPIVCRCRCAVVAVAAAGAVGADQVIDR